MSYGLLQVVAGVATILRTHHLADVAIYAYRSPETILTSKKHPQSGYLLLVAPTGNDPVLFFASTAKAYPFASLTFGKTSFENINCRRGSLCLSVTGSTTITMKNTHTGWVFFMVAPTGNDPVTSGL